MGRSHPSRSQKHRERTGWEGVHTVCCAGTRGRDGGGGSLRSPMCSGFDRRQAGFVVAGFCYRGSKHPGKQLEEASGLVVCLPAYLTPCVVVLVMESTYPMTTFGLPADSSLAARSKPNSEPIHADCYKPCSGAKPVVHSLPTSRGGAKQATVKKTKKNTPATRHALTIAAETGVHRLASRE